MSGGEIKVRWLKVVKEEERDIKEELVWEGEKGGWSDGMVNEPSA